MSRDSSLDDRIMEITTRVRVDAIDKDKFLQKKDARLSYKGFKELFYSFLSNTSRVTTSTLKPFTPTTMLLLTKPFDPAKFLGENWTSWKKSPYDNGNDVDPISWLTKIELASFIFETCPLGSYKMNSCKEIIREEKFRYQEKEFLELLYFVSNIFFYLWSDHKTNKENSILVWLSKKYGVSSIDLVGEVFPSDWYRFGQRSFHIRFNDLDLWDQRILKINQRRFRIDLVDEFPNARWQDKLDRRCFRFQLDWNCIDYCAWSYAFWIRSEWDYMLFSSGCVTKSV